MYITNKLGIQIVNNKYINIEGHSIKKYKYLDNNISYERNFIGKNPLRYDRIGIHMYKIYKKDIISKYNFINKIYNHLYHNVHNI